PRPRRGIQKPGSHRLVADSTTSFAGETMATEQRDEPKRKSGDRLGELLGTYSARPKGFMLLAVAIGVALLGLWVVSGATALSHALEDSEKLEGVYATIGWVLVGTGLLFAVWSGFYIGQSFEVRKRGVRHRRWGSRKELFWDDIDRIEVNKVTYVES